MARSSATAVAVSTSADLFPPPAPRDLDDEAYLAQAEGEIRGYGRSETRNPWPEAAEQGIGAPRRAPVPGDRVRAGCPHRCRPCHPDADQVFGG